MKAQIFTVAAGILGALLLFAMTASPAESPRPAATGTAGGCPAWLDQNYHRLRSQEIVNLCELANGKPLLIVNTASHCGFTPQFKGLQALHEKYGARGLTVVGFPSNDFFQEAADAAETAEVCYLNYGVKFTMLQASAVKGATANPTFRELARQKQAPSWNFNKYLVGASGQVLGYYDSRVAPDSTALRDAIEQALTGS